MIHQPASSYYDGQAGECVMEAEEVSKLRDCITKVYARRTGKPLWIISEDMERDVFSSAEEAQDYGVADPVALENSSTWKFNHSEVIEFCDKNSNFYDSIFFL